MSTTSNPLVSLAPPSSPVGYNASTGTVAPGGSQAPSLPTPVASSPSPAIPAAAPVAAPSSVSKGVPMTDSTGKPFYVPADKVQDATDNHGFKLSVNMTGPDSKPYHVPFDNQDDAQKNHGFTWDVDQDNEALKNYVSSQDYLGKTETFIDQAAKGAGNEAVGMVKGIPSMVAGAIPGAGIASDIMDIPSEYRDYEAARAAGKSPAEAAGIAARTVQQKIQNLAVLKDRVKEFSTNPGSATGKAIVDLIPLIIGKAIGEAAPVAGYDATTGAEVSDTVPTAATFDAASKPSLFKQVMQGEKVAQPQAQSALQTGAQSVTGNVAANPTSLRTLLDEPVDTVSASAKSLYRQIDQAAGTDFKALQAKLDNTEYQIGQLTDTEEDVAKEAALEKSRTSIMDKITSAKQDALDNGVDPSVLDQADAQFKQSRALQELQTKVFQNPNIVHGNSAMGTPETVDVDAAVKALQKMQDNTKYGSSRLEQALGKDGANTLLKNLYSAQRVGAKALKAQTVAKWTAGVVGIPAAGTVAVEGVRHLFE